MRIAIVSCVVFLASTLGTVQADDALPEIQGTLTSSLSTATANIGDQVTVANLQCTNLASAGFPDASCTGGRLTGQVTKVQKAGQGVRAQLQVQFNSLDIRTDQGSKTIFALFEIEQIGPNKNSGREATGALVGAAAGLALGKLLHLSSGAVVASTAAGAAGGFLLETNNRQDISIDQDQVVKVILKTVRRVQSH